MSDPSGRGELPSRPSRPAKRPRSKSLGQSPAPKSPARPDLDQIAGKFSDALAIIETAYAALDKAEELADRDQDDPTANALVTMDRGLVELRRVYTELELATRHFRGSES